METDRTRTCMPGGFQGAREGEPRRAPEGPSLPERIQSMLYYTVLYYTILCSLQPESPLRFGLSSLRTFRKSTLRFSSARKLMLTGSIRFRLRSSDALWLGPVPCDSFSRPVAAGYINNNISVTMIMILVVV